jgi:hypothetical protein
MSKPFLLSRVLLRFDSKAEDLLGELSAVALTPDGSLWLGSDEFLSVERLSLIEPCIYGEHEPFAIGDFVELVNQDDEIDIEGMDYANHYLWLTGSHSTKRKKAKGKTAAKDIARLSTIKTEPNRYLLTRIPVFGKELFKTCSHPDNPDEQLTAACLQKTAQGNILIDALAEDEHLGPFLTFPLPSKENGFDIEGLAVRGDRVFLGFRGPVFRGWAIILELEVEEKEPGILTLKEIGKEGRCYKKHFVQLNGLGVRELCLKEDDLIILAGPTMDVEGSMQVFRLKNALDRSEDTISSQESGELELMFDLPFIPGTDHAEGLALFSCLGQSYSLLVVYDSPDESRKVESNAIYADVFRLQ